MELHPFLESDVRPSPKWWYVLSTVGDSPSMRVGHSATFVPGLDSADAGRVFIIGGANPSGIFTEVWVLNLQTRTWDMLECPGFKGRYEHAAFTVANRPGSIFIFGGATQEGCLNDVQEMDVSTGVWKDVEVSGTRPAPRTHRSAAVVGSNVYFFSGGHSGAEPVADKSVHCLDTEAWAWVALNPKGNTPKPRHGHLMVATINDDIPERESARSSGSDGARLDCNSSNVGRNGRPLSASSKAGKNVSNGHNKGNHSTTSSSPRVYMHGGMSGSTFFDDLHVLDLEKESWSLVRKKRTTPSPRAAHEGIMYRNQMFVFGGMGQGVALDDAHKLNTDSNSWSKLEFEGPAPPNRLDFALCKIKLRVPVAGAGSASEAMCELSSSSASTREVLERELKPGSASSRDSFSDSTSVDEALFSLEPTNISHNQGQQSKTCNSAGEARSDSTGEEGCTQMEDVDLLLIHGGMDTEGEIFDDTLVLLLSDV